MEETKPQGVLAKLDAVLPRMWKEWLISALLVVALLFIIGTVFGTAASALERAGVILAKLPLLTIGGLLGYYGDRGLFPYARPGDLRTEQAGYIKRLLAKPVEVGFSQQEVDMINGMGRSFETASIRRAIIVAACILGAALGA